MRSVLLSMIASVALVGCVGDLESGGNTIGPGTNPNPNQNGMAQKMFEQNVYPLIHKPGAASDCSSCHDSKAPVGNITGFVAANPGDAYATITSFQSVVGNFTPATAGILTRLAASDVHSMPEPTGRGRIFSDAERQAITDWLAQEVVERAGGPIGTTGTETPGQMTARLLNTWTACMTLTNWQTAQMTTQWGNMQTDGGSDCKSCHGTGGQGMMISNVEESSTGGPPGMWTVVSSKEPYLIQYFTVDLTGAQPMVVINHMSFQGVATATPPHVEHPRFDPDNNLGMQALQQFYDLTQASLAGCMATQTKLDPPAS